MNNRVMDIEKLLEGLDLPVTMFRNATEKYKSIAAYFESKGFACDIYPFGSFSLGTVVCPYRGGEDPLYDLDFICCVHDERKTPNLELLRILLKINWYRMKLTKKFYVIENGISAGRWSMQM